MNNKNIIILICVVVVCAVAASVFIMWMNHQAENNPFLRSDATFPTKVIIPEAYGQITENEFHDKNE